MEDGGGGQHQDKNNKMRAQCERERCEKLEKGRERVSEWYSYYKADKRMKMAR